MSTTLVSIIMPVKNAEPWLKECLDSIKAQSFQTWELIAVDDHSSDESMTILNDYASTDERITVLSNDGDGIIDALNQGLDKAQCRYVTRMDADDKMPEHKLQRFYDLISTHPDSVVTGRVKYFSDEPISEGYLDYENWLNERCSKRDHWDWMYRECVIASANWIVDRKYLTFEENVYPEDYNTVFSWYEQNLDVQCVDEVTHLWREHPQRTSRNSSHYSQEAFFELKLEQFLAHTHDPKRPLGLMGANQKFKITSKWFAKRGIKTEQISLDQLHKVGEFIDPQILVCVFPAVELRDGIQDFLSGFGLEMGKDWWWL